MTTRQPQPARRWPSRALILGAVCLGAALGACVRNVVSDASAQAPRAGRLEYKVVGASSSNGAYEEDLNKFSSEGWRYVGPLPMGNGFPSLIFERGR